MQEAVKQCKYIFTTRKQDKIFGETCDHEGFLMKFTFQNIEGDGMSSCHEIWKFLHLILSEFKAWTNSDS